jgi:hypothetical protein
MNIVTTFKDTNKVIFRQIFDKLHQKLKKISEIYKAAILMTKAKQAGIKLSKDEN